MTSEELKIVNSLRTGQGGSHIKILYDKFFPKIRKYVMRNNGSYDDAMDVFHDTILVLHQNAMNQKLDKYDKLEGFLFVTAKNLWITSRTKEKARTEREARYAEDKLSDSVFSKVSDTSGVNGILNTLSLLGESCKEILSLSVLTDIPMEEISQRLGYSNADVAKATNYRCKKKLQDLIRSKPELVSFLKR